MEINSRSDLVWIAAELGDIGLDPVQEESFCRIIGSQGLNGRLEAIVRSGESLSNEMIRTVIQANISSSSS